MKARAAELFAGIAESEFGKDVEPINTLYSKVQALVLPHGDPRENKLKLQDEQDARQAERERKANPKREITLRPQRKGGVTKDETLERIMEFVTALRTIEILGQVLRNEATARKVPEMLEITRQVFRLGRRVLGFLFAVATAQLEKLIGNLEEHYRQRMPKAKADDVVDEVSRHLFNLYTFAAFAVVKHVASAVSERNLKEVFRQLVDGDPNLANRIYKLAIDLETCGSRLPLRDAEDLNNELSGVARSKNKRAINNNLAHTVVRALVVDYLHLNHVPREQVQTLCQKLNIELPPRATDPSIKRLPPPK